MKIIHRYLLREMAGPFIFAFLFFNFLLFIGIMFDLMELIFVENIAPLQVGKLILFKIPAFFDIVIPVSILFAGMLSFGRLSFDGEITALRSSGISLFKIGMSLLVLALLLTLLSFCCSSHLTPWCNRHYKETYREVLLQRPTLQVKEKTITDLKGKKLYTYHLNRENYEMERIVLYEFPPRQICRFPRITLAERGRFEEDALHLEKVTVHQIGENYRIKQSGEFNSQVIYLAGQLPKVGLDERTTDEMSLGELAKRLREEKLKKRPDEEEIKKIAIDFHTRIAIPLATFFIGMLALPLGIKLKKGGKSISLGVSLLIVIIYYVLLLAGQLLGKEGIMPPLLAVWLPNILIIIAGMWLNLRLIRI